MQRALFWKKKEDNRVLCRLCPKYCNIRDGKRGFCRVRENRGGVLYSLNYGRCSSYALDPVEKKPLYHFYPGSQILSLGTVGCNLRCRFCQNWEIAQGDPGTFKITPEQVVQSALREAHGGGSDMESLRSLLRKITGAGTGQSDERDGGSRAGKEAAGGLAGGERKNGGGHRDDRKSARVVKTGGSRRCIGIAYTYNEPFMWYEFVYDTARLAQEAGLKNVLVTNGTVNEEPLKKILPYIDAMNIDLKGFSDKYYRETCRGHFEPVLRTVEIAARECHVEVTTLLVPGLNDSTEEIEGLAGWLASISKDIPLHFTRYFPSYKFDLPPTPLSTMKKAREIAARKMNYVYLGNVQDPEGGNTVCPECGATVIRRSGYFVRADGLDGERCKNCGSEVGVIN